MPAFFDRLKNAWNAFTSRDPTEDRYFNYTPASSISYSYRPDRPRFTRGNERTIITAIYNRIALDVAAIQIQHVKLDENDRYLETVNSHLNSCLSLSANRDQTGRAFIQDVVMSMLDEGCVAIVPVDTTTNPTIHDSYDIETMRVAKILEWRPYSIKVRCYDENAGQYKEIFMPKNAVAVIENPMYAVMNEPNSTLKRLLRKMIILDAIDEQTGSNKLDLIIQLPYSINSPARKERADERRKDIEQQLSNTKYGIAYIDSTEHVTQLNRSLENNLLKQIEYWTAQLFAQLGITDTILNGTADEQTMLNYYNRTIEPIVAAIADEMKRKFLTKTARSQHQSIEYFRDPFKLVPINQIAEIADKFTRNEILTSNEIRQIVGMHPSKDPNADALRNSNISQAKDAQTVDINGNVISESQNPPTTK